jgi:DNA-binding LytR/AlgR family response regulator
LSTKLRCLLLDDELPGLTYLKMLCEQIPGLEVVKAFNSPELFLKEMADLDYDFCILDIEMPGMSGLQVANLLNGKPVIFTTAYKEYAAEAFDLNAIDYVRKPVKKERLQQAIQKVQNHQVTRTAEKQFFQANSSKGKSLIFFDQLLYVTVSDVDSRDKTAILSNGDSLILKNISFEKLLEMLPGDQFVRINKKELVALKEVQAFSFDEITTGIRSGSGNYLKLSLSEVYRNEFLTKIKL